MRNCYCVVVKERGTWIRPCGNAIPFHMKPSPTRWMKRQRVAISVITANEHSIDVIINFIVVVIHRSGPIVRERYRSTTFSLNEEVSQNFLMFIRSPANGRKLLQLTAICWTSQFSYFAFGPVSSARAGPRLILWEIVVQIVSELICIRCRHQSPFYDLDRAPNGTWMERL